MILQTALAIVNRDGVDGLSMRRLGGAVGPGSGDAAPVRSSLSLLADLATLCPIHIHSAHDMPAFTITTTPTSLPRRAFEVLDVSHRHGLAYQYTHAGQRHH